MMAQRQSELTSASPVACPCQLALDESVFFLMYSHAGYPGKLQPTSFLLCDARTLVAQHVAERTEPCLPFRNRPAALCLGSTRFLRRLEYLGSLWHLGLVGRLCIRPSGCSPLRPGLFGRSCLLSCFLLFIRLHLVIHCVNGGIQPLYGFPRAFRRPTRVRHVASPF